MSDEEAIDVLIVDDDVDFAEYLKEVAELVGLNAQVLSDPLQFKERYEKLKPMSVVLDVKMPGVDGVQLSSWLGSYAREKGIYCRLIIVSGFSPDYIRTCKSIASLAGVDDVIGLSKPIELETLKSALRGESTAQD